MASRRAYTSTSYSKDVTSALSWRTGLLAEVVASFVFWCMFLEFIAVLWFFPLEMMGFTGWEAVLVAIFVPSLTNIARIREAVACNYHKVRCFVLLAGLLGFNATFQEWYVQIFLAYRRDLWYVVHPNALRVVLVGLVAGLDLTAIVCRWVDQDEAKRERNAWALLLGFVVQVVIRMGFYTLNPSMLWNGSNLATMALVLASFLFLAREDATLRALAYKKSDATVAPARTVSGTGQGVFPVGLGLGVLLFLTQTMYSTHGVYPRWLELGPFPSGLVIVGAFVAGILLSGHNRLIFMLLAVLGVVGSALVGLAQINIVPKYVGLMGGAVFGTFIASQWLPFIKAMSSLRRPGGAMFVTSVVYTLFVFWSIWVVAYKFIPWYLGSGVLRERNRSMLVVAAILVAAARLLMNRVTFTSRWRVRPSVVGLLALLLFLLAAPITLLRFQGMSQNDPSITAVATQGGKPLSIKAMVWNIHFGYDHYGRVNFERVARAIEQEQINVLGIMESDLTRMFMANRDFVEYLEKELQMYSDFGPSTAENTWGCGLLSAFPIVHVTRTVLPSPEGELACLLDATLNVSGRNVTVFVTHFGNTEDKLDRELQTEGMTAVATANPGPSIFLGYITDRPHSANYNRLLSSGMLDTTTDLRRYCQYVFYKPGPDGMVLDHFYRWDSTDLSDTEGQVGMFSLTPK
eukprot:TRINITY_DN4543_c1_g1_i1.p1 TRINITY_DN4543_c1_g1~~TRINITY_DN4543_c1_g1_i1.p1  ORF type:complete len:688 (+),score=114.24 TRINITY_DN4543_c1_g1_i1:43-2106(+)